MKTSKEMQLKIIEQVQEDLSQGRHYLYSIEWLKQSWEEGECEWGIPLYLDFYNFEYRVRPKTIKINGKCVPRPMSLDDLREAHDLHALHVYYPSASGYLYESGSPYFAIRRFYNGMLVYRTKEEAVEVSKLLFDIKE